MASKRKQKSEALPTEAELLELDGLVAMMHPNVWLEVEGEVFDRDAIRRHLGQLIAISRAENNPPKEGS